MSVVTLLNAVSANTTGPVAGLGTPYGNLTVSVSTTGTVSAFSVVVQGSIDGFNFEAIGSAITSTTAGTSVGSGVLFQYFQAVLSGYSGTGTVTVELAYSLNSSASGGGGPPTGAAGGVLTGTYPNPGITTLNQNTTGTAANLSGTPACPAGTTATTQTGGDSSTKLATTAFVQGALPGAASTSTAGIVELDGTAADIAAAGSQSAGTGSLAPLSTHVHPENAGAIASDYTVSATALKAWNYDLMLASVAGGATFTTFPAAGTVYLARVNIRQAITPTKAVIWNSAPASGESGYYLALFSSSGTQLGSTSSDQSGASSGLLAASIGSPGSLAAGTYVYVALLIVTQGSTKGGAVFWPLTGASPNQYNAGTVAAYRWASNPAATTVASGSNGGEISAVASWSSPSAGVLDVATTTGWPTSGTVTVAASGSTTAVVTYTGTAAGQLTGCAYVSGSATGTVSTGGAVTLTWTSMPSSLTLTSNASSLYGFWCGLQ